MTNIATKHRPFKIIVHLLFTVGPRTFAGPMFICTPTMSEDEDHE